jgi:ATP-dependent DNA helicase RecQ
MIERGEVEPSKIAKSVLVIDEAQDMGADDFQLVLALMQQNEDMRVIAVGDDDQNIYAFRGSDSKYMHSLARKEGAKLYEMTDNYRSAKAVVDCANRFVQRIPGRMKHNPIQTVTEENGKVMTRKSLSDAEINVQGTTAVLTRTNEEAMQVAYELEQRGLHATVTQSMGGFRFGNLAEVRYFLRQIGKNDNVTISKERWQEAKQHTLETYARSNCLSIMQHFFADFEVTHQYYYHSDLREYIFESNIEDFVAADEKTIFVSTIHKAKGREFDNVYLLSSIPDKRDINDTRAYYVGLTRAKRNLYLIPNPPTAYSSIMITLNMHDVWLDFFKGRKDMVLRLRSGDRLQYRDGFLLDEQDINIAALSLSGKDKLKAWTDKGYEVTSAKVSYTVAWKPQDANMEYAVCLANIVLSKCEQSEQNSTIAI